MSSSGIAVAGTCGKINVRFAAVLCSGTTQRGRVTQGSPWARGNSRMVSTELVTT